MARTYRDYTEQDWFMEPSFIRFHHRFRGHRESYKINADLGAIRFDIYKMYQEIDGTLARLDDKLTDILEGAPSWMLLTTP